MSNHTDKSGGRKRESGDSQVPRDARLIWLMDQEEYKQLSLSDIRVLWAIFYHAALWTGKAEMSRQTIAEKAGVSVSTVTRCLTKLERAELISVEHRPGRHRMNRYVLAPTATTAWYEDRFTKKRSGEMEKDVTSVTSLSTDADRKRGQTGEKKRSDRLEKDVTPVTSQGHGKDHEGNNGHGHDGSPTPSENKTERVERGADFDAATAFEKRLRAYGFTPTGRARSLVCDFVAVKGADEAAMSVGRSTYGLELLLDLHGCDSARFTRESIKDFCTELCKLIDMEQCDLHFWDDVGVSEDEQQTDPKTKGTSAVQFILTSTIVIHTLDLMEAAYVNIFSCKKFDTDAAAKFTAEWFGSTDWTTNVVVRR